MLRLHDQATGRATPVEPARRGHLRTYTRPPAPAGHAGPGGLRCYLVADLVRRVAERHNLLVSAWQSPPSDAGTRPEAGLGARPAGAAAAAGGEPGGTAALRAACDALNIYPAEFSSSVPEPLDVGIGEPAAAREGRADGAAPCRWIRAGRVLAGDAATAGMAAHPTTLPAAGLDPLALRAALLGEHYRRPVSLDWSTLTTADRMLRRWRRQVAEWATAPSKPPCARHLDEVTAAFDDDLATPVALRVLDALARDAGVPPGAKFETFAYLDRLLGLDLAREVGR